MSSFEWILWWLYFLLVPLFLHEFGHWIMLRRFRIPFKVVYTKTSCIGFEELVENRTEFDNLRSLRVGLAGAVTPLFALIPLLYFGPVLIIAGVLTSFVYALWTVYEVWHNILRIERGEE